MRIIGLVLMWGGIVFGQLPGDFDTNGVYNCFDIDGDQCQVTALPSSVRVDLRHRRVSCYTVTTSIVTRLS